MVESHSSDKDKEPLKGIPKDIVVLDDKWWDSDENPSEGFGEY